jgi:pimeloyl-ACP methyl ester carboxylesterase
MGMRHLNGIRLYCQERGNGAPILCILAPAARRRVGVGEYADDAAALLDVLAAAPASSSGAVRRGTVATDLALRYPDRVRALVLLDPDAPHVLAPAIAAWVDALADPIRRVAAREGVDAVAQPLVCELAGAPGWTGPSARDRELARVR